MYFSMSGNPKKSHDLFPHTPTHTPIFLLSYGWPEHLWSHFSSAVGGKPPEFCQTFMATIYRHFKTIYLH